MEAKAQARFVRVTPLKARRVVDLIRGKRAGEADSNLRFAPQSAATPLLKVVRSAVANARVLADQSNEPFNETDLVSTEAHVDAGPTLKRPRPRAQRRATQISTRTSHITVIVAPRQAVVGAQTTSTQGRAR